MATDNIVIDGTPVQLTDGNECACVGTPAGVSVYWADSDGKPDKMKRDFINGHLLVGPPIKLWAWTSGNPVEMAVTKWQPKT